MMKFTPKYGLMLSWAEEASAVAFGWLLILTEPETEPAGVIEVAMLLAVAAWVAE